MCDVYDALTSERPYKRAWSSEEALVLIRDERGAHFDPRLADLFIEMMGGTPVATGTPDEQLAVA